MGSPMEANMKTIVTAAALAATVAVGATMVAAQNDAPSSTVSAGFDRRSYDVGGFEKIVAVGPHHFVVTVGGATSVRAEGPAESLDKYVVEIDDGALEIKPKKDEWDDWNWEEFQVEPATYYITLPRLEATVLAGSGDMRVDRIDGDEFAASIAGSGALDVGTLSVNDAKLAVAGSGQLRAAGSVREVHVSIAGSGDLDAPRLASDNAKISIAGSGNAHLTVDEEAHISVVGSGDVEIAGNARCTISGFGSGRARCKDGIHETKREWESWGMWTGPRGREDWGDWQQWREWRRDRRVRRDDD
jgi:hypothetical protein